MKAWVLAAICFGLLTGSASSSALMTPGDFYLISREQNGVFTGSHKIFQRQSEGMHQVIYCGRSYWIRPVSVAWTQVEVENRREVRVEFNFGKGWRPICDKPERQVTLHDIGIDQDARIVLYTNGQDLGGVNRFSTIADSFKTGNRRQKTSYHD
ncbi:hypothetical protein [Roseibium algae]|uniref:Uncharacterized protein n=1 Tax=Roseibium algae TaxID=3123038 RepID=A0ABU8TSK4_9HYPH